MATFDKYGWYSGNQYPGRHTEVEPSNTYVGAQVGRLRANWTGLDWVDIPYEVPPTSSKESYRQSLWCELADLKTALSDIGLYSAAEALVMAEGTPRKYVISWNNRLTIARTGGISAFLRTGLNKTHVEWDDIFEASKAIKDE
jgi:hypothetical protein